MALCPLLLPFAAFRYVPPASKVAWGRIPVKIVWPWPPFPREPIHEPLGAGPAGCRRVPRACKIGRESTPDFTPIPEMADRYFTLQEARELVPWLVQTFRDIEPLRERARRLAGGVRELTVRMRGNGGGESRRRMEHLQRELSETSSLINERIDEVRGRGMLVKGVDPSLVDFPHMREGREAYLCWREGESQLGFWHDVDAGFAGRQPL